MTENLTYFFLFCYYNKIRACKSERAKLKKKIDILRKAAYNRTRKPKAIGRSEASSGYT